ncbi:MAG: tetratricopeptide repeat protein [Halioglobus sp.]
MNSKNLSDLNTSHEQTVSINQTHTFVVAGLVGLLVLLYQQSFAFDYAYYDDDMYIIDNPMVLAGLSFEGLQWALTSFYGSNWHPLTWLSHMLDISLFGIDPRGAHIHNTVLHGISTLLVYVLLLRLTTRIWPSALLAAIFLVHPLHVESVAWIAERKDLLCAVFFLLALIFYDTYRKEKTTRAYLATLGCTALALLAKPMAVSLPVLMVLMDLTVYRSQWLGDKQSPTLGSLVKMAADKTPLIAITFGTCVLTVLAQDGAQAVAHLEAHSITDRLETASNAYWIYLKQWVVPTNLVAFYPLALEGSLRAWLVPTASLSIVSVIALMAMRRAPLVAIGWGWYLISLLPVIGLVQVGAQAHADRYMYLPSVGLLIAASTLFPPTQSRYLRSSYFLTGVFTAFLTVLCYWQIGMWKSQYTLFSSVLAQIGPNHKAYVHLTAYHLRHGELDTAQKYAALGIELAPKRSDGYQALGNIALQRGQFPAAEAHYRQAITRGPLVGPVFNNLGIALSQQGKQQQAAKAFAEALRIQPSLQAAQENLRRHNTHVLPKTQ